jgi:hypothetical protein
MRYFFPKYRRVFWRILPHSSGPWPHLRLKPGRDVEENMIFNFDQKLDFSN